MRNILVAVSLLFLLIVLLPSCNNKHDKLNDYLPLRVGAKYKYNYLASYGYINENSVQKGECTWTFISKSFNTHVVYQVEQSFKGDYVRGNYSGPTDSVHYENQITTLSFEDRNDGNVDFTFPVPYFGDNKVTFERFIQSDKIDTCLRLNSGINSGCLRKNIGITSFNFHLIGNHQSHVSYTLIAGPY